MIKVRIGDIEKELSDVDEHWINQQIVRGRADGQVGCVRVTIQKADLDMLLATPTCVSSGGGSRPPRPPEMRVFDLWNQRGLNDIDSTDGNLVAFLKQLKNLL